MSWSRYSTVFHLRDFEWMQLYKCFLMFVVSFLSLQNLFHYLCEQTGGAVKLPDAKGVSACMLKTFISEISYYLWRTSSLSFYIYNQDMIYSSMEFHKSAGWSLESLLWRASTRDSGWICHEIWYRVHLPSDDVSNKNNKNLDWLMNIFVKNFDKRFFFFIPVANIHASPKKVELKCKN